jgi:fumarate hydratase class I
MKAVKLATTGYLDTLPTSGDAYGRAFRDPELERRLLEAAWKTGIGAQFGGKYFALDARVIRLPRHGASCPIGVAVSCSAHRNIKARITRDGIWLEQLERNPGRLLPDRHRRPDERGIVKIDLNRPMSEILAQLSRHPVKTRLALTGSIVVARDIAHAQLKERLDAGGDLPDYFKDHPVYYAGPAKTPEGMASGSLGPTTAGRMDSYVDLFQARGGSLVMLAKGNRSRQVVEACRKHGGFYLGSIGGPAALLAKEHIRKVELIEYPELGMEAIYRIEVVDFPAFILIDDKGNDFFSSLS